MSMSNKTTLYKTLRVSSTYSQHIDYHHQACIWKFTLTMVHQLTFIFSHPSRPVLKDRSSFVICYRVCQDSANPRASCFYAAGSRCARWRIALRWDAVLVRMLRQTTAASSARTAVWQAMMNDSYSELAKMCSWSSVINGWILEGAQRHARLDICCCACLKMH